MFFKRKIADNTKINSLAARFRKKRYLLFWNLLECVDRPVTILDVGGTQTFWESVGFIDNNDIRITLLNLSEQAVSSPCFRSIIGNARHMPQFADSKFDVVFSNSVIEHVGSYEDQRKMAEEIKRVGKRYFVQTPNKYFPVEPHFLFPFFQFLPVSLRAWLLTKFDLGWIKKIPDFQTAKKQVESIQLLSKHGLLCLFPEAHLYRERFYGLTKSFVVYCGWNKYRL